MFKLFNNNNKLQSNTNRNIQQRHVVILGSGFAGIEVLKGLQKNFATIKVWILH